MQTKKPLRAKTPLRAKALKPKKQVKPTITKLRKQADEAFSLYVLYRDGSKHEDGSWWATCITCGAEKMFKDAEGRLDKRPIHWGHFQSSRYNSTRYHEFNANAQCQSCNIWNQGEQYKYSKEVDLKYGDGTKELLVDLAQQSHRFTTDELEEIIFQAERDIEFYEHSY